MPRSGNIVWDRVSDCDDQRDLYVAVFAGVVIGGAGRGWVVQGGEKLGARERGCGDSFACHVGNLGGSGGADGGAAGICSGRRILRRAGGVTRVLGILRY